MNFQNDYESYSLIGLYNMIIKQWKNDSVSRTNKHCKCHWHILMLNDIENHCGYFFKFNMNQLRLFVIGAHVANELPQKLLKTKFNDDFINYHALFSHTTQR